MIAKKYKLPVKNFSEGKGRSIRTSNFLLKIFSPTAPFSRCGALVSKKIRPTAVSRNQLKRQIFTVFWEQHTHIPLGDYLIIILPAAAKNDDRSLIADLIHLFQNL